MLRLVKGAVAETRYTYPNPPIHSIEKISLSLPLLDTWTVGMKAE